MRKMIVQTSIKNRILGGGVWAFSGKVATVFSGLVINAILARLLTPGELGAYFLTVSLVWTASIVAQLGLHTTVVSLVAESMATHRQARAKQSIKLSLLLTLVGGLIVGSILAFGGGKWIADGVFHSHFMSQAMGLVAVWVIIFTFQNLIAEIFRGFHDIRLATIYGGLSTSFLSMLMFGALWFYQGHSDFREIIILSVVAGLISIIFSSLITGRSLNQLPSNGNSIQVKDILRISWPIWITTLAFFVLSQVDLWILGLFGSHGEVAVYGAAMRLMVVVAMPLVIVNSVVPPIIAEMYAQNNIKILERILRTTATFAGLPAIIVFIVFIFWGDISMLLIFGDSYTVGSQVLVILSIGQVANVLAGSCGLTLMLTGHQTQVMIITIVSGIGTVVGALLLVRSFAGMGVASAAAVGMIVQNILLVLVTKRKVGVWTHFGLGTIRDGKNLFSRDDW